MIRSQVVLFFVVLSLLFSSCGAIQRLPPEPVEEADHNLAIIAPAASLATATPLPRHYLPFLYVPKASPTPTPTITPTKRPVSDGHTFPPYSTSLYLKTVDGSALYNMGCQAGLKDLNTPGAQDSLVILAFGYPKFFDGKYGARLYGVNGPVTVDQISYATIQFAWGYYTCTGTDYDSHLRIGIGTSNYEGTDAAVNFAHGQAWAKMVNQVNAWLIQNRASGQVDVVGANDIELSWNYYTKSKDWLDGYDSANQYDLYNFGAIPGCPTLEKPGAQCGTYPYVWSREQVWYVIYGAGPVYPLPEIYLTNGVNAEQWYLMSVYSVNAHGFRVGFIGSLTTYQACLQVGGCRGTGWAIDNTPEQGWTQLYKLLNSSPRTAQGLRWASDMKWTSATTGAAAFAAGAAGAFDAGSGLPAPDANRAAEADLRGGLQAGALSDTMKLGLQEKLDAAQWAENIRRHGAADPAPKNRAPATALLAPALAAPIEVKEKIVEGSEGLVKPSFADIHNLWQGMVGGEPVVVLAGASGGDAGQGILVLLADGDDPAAMRVETYLAPAGAGSLRIVERQGGQLILQASSGAAVRFDLGSRAFIQP